MQRSDGGTPTSTKSTKSTQAVVGLGLGLEWGDGGTHTFSLNMTAAGRSMSTWMRSITSAKYLRIFSRSDTRFRVGPSPSSPPAALRASAFSCICLAQVLMRVSPLSMDHLTRNSMCSASTALRVEIPASCMAFMVLFPCNPTTTNTFQKRLKASQPSPRHTLKTTKTTQTTSGQNGVGVG